MERHEFTFDWLSRDEAIVDSYIRDPYCGAVCTAGFYDNLLYGIKQIQKSENIMRIPKKMPVLLLGGDMDAVGNYGKNVVRLAEIYRNAGLQNVTCKIYAGARHELVNEINKKEVMGNIVEWLDQIMLK